MGVPSFSVAHSELDAWETLLAFSTFLERSQRYAGVYRQLKEQRVLLQHKLVVRVGHLDGPEHHRVEGGYSSMASLQLTSVEHLGSGSEPVQLDAGREVDDVSKV